MDYKDILAYLGLDADEFEEYYDELDGAERIMCSNLLTQLSTSTSDPERDDLKTQLYELLSLVPDAELSNVLNFPPSILPSISVPPSNQNQA